MNELEILISINNKLGYIWIFVLAILTMEFIRK